MNPILNSFTGLLALAEVLSNEDLFEIRTENSDLGQIVYLGKNQTENASTAEFSWFIKKFLYDTNGFLARVQLPDSGIGFLYSWDLRATYFS
jgi:hypothetical protein